MDTVLASKLTPSSSSSQSSVQHFLLNLFSIFQYFYNILSSSSSFEDGSDVLQVTVGLIDLFTVFASLNGSFSSSLSLSSSSSSFSSSSLLDETWSVCFTDAFAQYFHSNGTNSFLLMTTRLAAVEEMTFGTAKINVSVCKLLRSIFVHLDRRKNTSRLFEIFQKADTSGKGFVTSYEFFNNLQAKNGITRYNTIVVIVISIIIIITKLVPLLKIYSMLYSLNIILLM